MVVLLLQGRIADWRIVSRHVSLLTCSMQYSSSTLHIGKAWIIREALLWKVETVSIMRSNEFSTCD